VEEALVAFIGGLLGALIGVYGAQRTSEFKHDSDVLQKRLDLRLRQLNEFYGPLHLQRRRSQGLRKRLPQYEKDPATGADRVDGAGHKVRWRLVENIEEARSNENYAKVVDSIIAAGDEVAQILMERAGLIAHERPPQSFQLFIQHHDRLKASWKAGVSQPEGEEWPFPGAVAIDDDLSRCAQGDVTLNVDTDIDCAIELGMRSVREDITAITTLRDFKGRPMFEPMNPPVDLPQSKVP
jgi:hypothetical protein